MFKKFIFVFLFSFIFFMSVNMDNIEASSFTNIKGVVMLEDDISYLKQIGFSDDYINIMTQEDFNNSVESKGKVISTDINYIKIVEQNKKNLSARTTLISNPFKSEVFLLSKEQFEKETSNLKNFSNDMRLFSLTSSTATSYKRMVTTITDISTSSTVRYKLNNYVEWMNSPTECKIDISAIGINQSEWQPVEGSHRASLTYQYVYAGAGNSSHTVVPNVWYRSASGYAVKLDYPSSPGLEVSVFPGYSNMSFFVRPVWGVKPRVDAYGQYAHQTTNSNLSLSVSFTGATLNVQPSNKFTYHPSTHASSL